MVSQRLLMTACMMSLLVSCGGGIPAPRDEFSQYIDPSITGDERAMIVEYLKSVPVDYRNNRILIDDGSRQYVSDPTLRTSFARDPNAPVIITAGSGSGLQSQDLKSIAYNCNNAYTGPYFKVASRLALSGIISTFTPPSSAYDSHDLNANNFQRAAKDSIHLYQSVVLSGAPASNEYLAIDAGLQREVQNGYQYRLFLNVGGSFSPNNPNGIATADFVAGQRFPGVNPVTISLFFTEIGASKFMTVTANEPGFGGGKGFALVKYLTATDTNPNDGFNPTPYYKILNTQGKNMFYRSVISIAQLKNAGSYGANPGYFRTGSYARNTQLSQIKGIRLGSLANVIDIPATGGIANYCGYPANNSTVTYTTNSARSVFNVSIDTNR